jgi:alkylmercury lyase
MGRTMSLVPYRLLTISYFLDMDTGHVEQTNALIERVAARGLFPHAVRLLAEGEPVELERLASAARWPAEDVDAALDAQTSAERDDQGRLVGLALTLRPTPHRFIVEGRQLYAWCASDTLLLPVVLGRPAVVKSTCPQTGQPIHVEVGPDGVKEVDPATAVVSAVRPADESADVRADACVHGHFFSSTGATTSWSEAHPDGHVLTVGETFRLDRQVIERLGWQAAAREGNEGTT